MSLYLMRSLAVAALLFGYYWLFLRNRAYHRWNRGFLLGAVLLAVLAPLMPMPVLFRWAGGDGSSGWPGVMHGDLPGSWRETAGSGLPAGSEAGGVDWRLWVFLGYASVAGWLGFVFLRELGFIARLYRRYPRERRGDILLLFTSEPGTPFSFLKTIYWNSAIELESAEGRQMLRHELVHVRQRHTIDLLLMRPLMIVFWFNPFFYWIYRELRTLHEFEADRCAMEGADRFVYAELLVQQVLEGRGGLFHSFFSSPLKRRINMITQSSVVRPGRWSRWMVAPFVVLLFCAFSGRGDLPGRRPGKPGKPAKPMTVVVDAGHGGWDGGAIASNGLKEKDINLSIARKVKQLASEYGVTVVLTRDQDILAGATKNRQASLHFRSNLAVAKNADLFISLHTDAGSGAGQSGFHVYLSKDNIYFQQSARLGSALIDALRMSYAVGNQLVVNREHVWVLRAANVPAVLILCGDIDNERDRVFISDAANQEKIARNILQGVVNYSEAASGQ